MNIIGGFTALSTKGVASLLSDTLWRTLTFPVTYLLVFVLVLTALMQIRYVNRALQRFDSTQVIPVQFVLFTISVIIGSAVLYRDFQSANANRFGKFFGGCALTFLGVYLVTSGRSEGASEGFDDDTDDEENTIGLVDEERYRDEVADNEDRRPRRKSSISFNLETDLESRQSSRQQTSSGPRTPPLLLSQTSTASSRLSTRSQDMLAPLTGNSWRSADVSARPRPNNNAISSPLLPSEAQCTTPPAPKRPSSLSRRSMARLTPGPLMSPLSASLSAVIADELRRGVDSPSRRSRVRKSRSQRTTIDAGETTSPLKNSPLKTAALPEEAVDEEDGRPAPAVRSRTISATMGNFFQLKGDRSKGKGRYGNDDTQ